VLRASSLHLPDVRAASYAHDQRMTTSHNPTLSLRIAHDDETSTVRRLADLDDSPPLEGQTLLALVDGEAVAALSLFDGRVVANPFRPTADAVTLLGLRASQLRGRGRRARPVRMPRLRLRAA
jgi:hypothetical protein